MSLWDGTAGKLTWAKALLTSATALWCNMRSQLEVLRCRIDIVAAAATGGGSAAVKIKSGAKLLRTLYRFSSSPFDRGICSLWRIGR
jgi:hypothetical protein